MTDTEMRECRTCHAEKPLTLQFFTVRTYPSGNRAWRSQCRECRNTRVDELRNGERAPSSGPKSARVCDTCGSMTHRVPGIRCPDCGLRYQAEAKPELVLRNFDRAM